MTATSRAKPSSVGQWQATGRVIALVTGRADAARITAALRPMPVLVVASLRELRSAFGDPSHHCAGLLVESRDVNGESTAAFINALADQHRVPILGYVSSGALHADALRDLAKAGVHDLVFRETDDAAVFLSAKFARGEEARAAASVLARISAHTPAQLVPVAEYVLNYPREKHTVSRVASALGVNRRTLTNWSTREGCPPPGIVITWCRLLLAAELLQVPGRSVERTVNALDFASPSSFRNLCQKYLHRRPSTLSTAGALDEAYHAYASIMRPQGPKAPSANPIPASAGSLR